MTTTEQQSSALECVRRGESWCDVWRVMCDVRCVMCEWLVVVAVLTALPYVLLCGFFFFFFFVFFFFFSVLLPSLAVVVHVACMFVVCFVALEHVGCAHERRTGSVCL